MERRTRQNSILTLKKLRDAYQSQLDTSVVAELDSVIAALEREGEEERSVAKAAKVAQSALEVIAKVISIVSNIDDWMN